MKKILFLICLAVFTFGSHQSYAVSFDDGTSWNCDQYFSPTPVRYMKLYSFFDTWNNGSANTVYMNDYAVRYQNASYLSAGQPLPDGKQIGWTPSIRSSSFAVPAFSSMQVLSTQSEDWGIVNHPTNRSNPGAGQYDFMIAYKVFYDFSNNYPDASDDKEHVECQPYYVTWCGDGTVDSQYEQCDPSDTSRTGWGNGGCSTSCTPIENQSPINGTCNSTWNNATIPAGLYAWSDFVTNGSACTSGTPVQGSGWYPGSGPWTWSCQGSNGGTTANCNLNVAVPPVCGTAGSAAPHISRATNPLVSDVANLCRTGTAANGSTVRGGVVVGANGWDNNTTATWTCTSGSQSVTCGAVGTNPDPQCNTAMSGPITTAISSTTSNLCSIGSVSNFRQNAVGNTTNYSWSCVRPGVVVSPQPNVACSASYTPPATPVCGTAGSVAPHSSRITNPLVTDIANLCRTGTAANGRTVRGGVVVGANGWDSNTTATWTCTSGTESVTCGAIGGTSPTNTPVCSTTVQGNLSSTISNGSCDVGNVVGFSAVGTNPISYSWACTTGSASINCSAQYGSVLPVCTPGTTVGIQGAPITAATPGLCPAGQAVGGFAATVAGATTNYSWSCNGSAVGGACTASYNPTVLPTGFDLGVRKYIGTNDAQTSATAVSTTNGSGLTYQVVVTNLGPGVSTGTTTLRDNLPAGVTFAGSGSWTNGNWNCAYTGTLNRVTCTNAVDRVASGANLGSTIFIPITVTTTTTPQTVVNQAHIDNPSENTRCTSTGALPGDESSTCTLDTRNSDPAFFAVGGGGGGGGGGGPALTGKICINGIPSCANFTSLNQCIAAGVPSNLCYPADTVGQNLCSTQNLVCTGPGGGGGGGCSPGDLLCSRNRGGSCGDGVLQVGEECDVVGAPWCQSCNFIPNTLPGSNPVRIWMTIPTLSRTSSLGYSWLDGIPGKIPFEENRMVLGLGTKAFTLADTVGFGISSKYTFPIMIEADKKICLKSSGAALNSETICTTFGDAAMLDPRVVTWNRPLDGKPYVILGKGDFQYQESRTGPYYVRRTTGPNDIDLFHGPRQYLAFGGGTPTLNSTFYGMQVGSDGLITLATNTMDLVSLPVRISSALVGTTSTPVNRSIENFVSRASLNAFLSSIRASTNTSATTTTRSDLSPTSNLTVNIGATGDKSVRNLTDLETLALNGNKNILALKGNLTLENCTGNTFVMDGVRTVIVEGNLIIKCNTVYGSSDTTSSWAWIVKGGDTLIDPGIATNQNSGVSKISGVYVTVGIGGIGGQFKSIADIPSQKIFRVDGSLYGYAKPLLDSRLYARGTSAYEILTTGTILTYSNRALINPPPLLSEYLGNYNVERVVR